MTQARLFLMLAALSVAAACRALSGFGGEHQVERLIDSERYVEALPPAERLFAEAARQADPALVVEAGVRLSKVLRLAGDPQRALRVSEEVLQRAESGLPFTDLRRADAAEELAKAKELLSLPADAEDLYTRSLHTRESVLGSRDRSLTPDLRGLARIYFERSDYSKAEEYVGRAISIQEEQPAPDRRELAAGLQSRGDILRARGNYDAARETLSRSLAIYRDLSPQGSSRTALVLESLAQVDIFSGQYERALGYFEDAKSIQARIYGPASLEVARSNQNLAYVLATRGRHAEARVLYDQALNSYAQLRGPDDANVGLISINAGNNEYLAGDPAKAQRLLTKAIEILEKLYGEETESVGVAMEIRGFVYGELGLLQESAAETRRAIAIFEKTLGPVHLRIGTALNSLADVEQRRGRYAEAEVAYARAQEMLERTVGPANHFVATALLGRARIERLRGNRSRARSLLMGALAIRRETFGSEDSGRAQILVELARIEAADGAGRRARELLDEAMRSADQWLEPTSQIAVDARLEMAALAWRDSPDQAFSYLKDAQAQLDKRISRSAGALSEHVQSQLFQQLADLMDVAVSFQFLHRDESDAIARLAFQAVLSRKGRTQEIVADQWAQARRRAGPADREVLEKLRDVRREIARVAYEESDLARAEKQERIASLEATQVRLEQSIADGLPLPTGAPLTVAEVGAAIPADTVLIDFVRYRSGGLDRSPLQAGQERYAAYVLGPEGELHGRDLGPAAKIDRAIRVFRESIATPDDARFRACARAVDRAVLEPLGPLLRGKTRLIVSPDAALDVLPFGALIDAKGKYRIESLHITYLDSSRDLVRNARPRDDQGRALVIGAPDFETPGADDRRVAEARRQADSVRLTAVGAALPAGGDPGEERGRRSRDFQGVSFAPLPGAQAELREVAERLGVEPVLGASATEGLIKSVSSPWLLHIATHAFFLEDAPRFSHRPAAQRARNGETAPSPGLRGAFENPLLRSGLAFAGANRLRSGADDGVLTALEAAGLDLEGTELLVLSACDTGLGEVRSADGVYGLRRAFALAGVRSQVMSLWNVNDQATRRLMSEFYRRLSSGQARGEALRQAQLALLRGPVLRSPYFWAAFVLAGDWRPLPKSTQP